MVLTRLLSLIPFHSEDVSKKSKRPPVPERREAKSELSLPNPTDLEAELKEVTRCQFRFSPSVFEASLGWGKSSWARDAEVASIRRVPKGERVRDCNFIRECGLNASHAFIVMSD